MKTKEKKRKERKQLEKKATQPDQYITQKEKVENSEFNSFEEDDNKSDDILCIVTASRQLHETISEM